MKLLVLGSGGREHALAQTLQQSAQVTQVFVGPGNGGMWADGTLLPGPNVGSQDDFDSVKDFVIKHDIGLVVVGPEKHLATGIVDYLSQHGIPTYGPTKQATRLESSKIYAKQFMQQQGIPTADFFIGDSYDDALALIAHHFNDDEKIVIKADGLADGKGVVVAENKAEAKQAIHDFMVNDKIAVTTQQVLIEKCLYGQELSVLALCDGQDYKILGMACDHKRLNDGDLGPNTGGMGCYSVRDWPSDRVKQAIAQQIIEPTLTGMANQGTPFTGTLFCGLMIGQNATGTPEVNVIEYNVRFGDPETQTLLPLLQSDLYSLLYACTNQSLAAQPPISLADKDAVHVVKSSQGYPSIDYQPMLLNQTIEQTQALSPDAHLYYAGVALADNRLVNSGGRVLGVTALGESLTKAKALAYDNIENINFAGNHLRTDIGAQHLGDKNAETRNAD